MVFFDLILLLILFGFVWFGFWNGFIQTIGGIISLIVAVFVASRWYDVIALQILPWLGDNFNLARLLAFIAVFILARFILFLIFKAINKFFELPILKFFNRLAGAAFGLIEGGLIIGLLLYFSTSFPITGSWNEMIETSILAGFLIPFGKVLLPLLPAALKQVKEIF
ncbi:CvpA family protein [Patescibacteria group bacterium]|nr:CvpA family protein [Patescibacteria group bacterium]